LDVLDSSTTTDVAIGLRNSQLADLICQIAPAELPETHVLDSSCDESPRAARDKLNVFDFEGQ